MLIGPKVELIQPDRNINEDTLKSFLAHQGFQESESRIALKRWPSLLEFELMHSRRAWPVKRTQEPNPLGGLRNI